MTNHILIPLATAVRLHVAGGHGIDWDTAPVVREGEQDSAPVERAAGRRVFEEGAGISPGVYLDSDGDVAVVKGAGEGEQVIVGLEDLYVYRDSADADGWVHKGMSRYISWPLTQLHVFEETNND